MKRHVLSVIALALSTVPAFSQSEEARVLHSGGEYVGQYLYEMRTGTLRALDGPTADIGATVFGGTVGTSALCFDNSADVDDSVVVFPGEELVDWGTLDCGLTGIVGGFRIQIQTTAIDTGVGGPGASIGIGFWKDTPGFGDPGTLTEPFARFLFTGLPGSLDGTTVATFDLFVDLIDDSEFCMPDGPIGWSYVGIDGKTGPLLIDVNAAEEGVVDAFDSYTFPASPESYRGTVTLAGAPRSSFFLELYIDDGSVQASTVINNGTGVNIIALTPLTEPVIDETWLVEVDASAHPGIVGTGVLISAGSIFPFPTAFGEVLIDLNQLVTSIVQIDSNDVQTIFMPVPKSLALVGRVLFAQGFKIGGGVRLSNAVILQMGF